MTSTFITTSKSVNIIILFDQYQFFFALLLTLKYIPSVFGKVFVILDL